MKEYCIEYLEYLGSRLVLEEFVGRLISLCGSVTVGSIAVGLYRFNSTAWSWFTSEFRNNLLALFAAGVSIILAEALLLLDWSFVLCLDVLLPH